VVLIKICWRWRFWKWGAWGVGDL